MKKLEIIPFSEISEKDWTNFHQSSSDQVLFYQYPFLSAYKETTQEKVDILTFKENGELLIALPGNFDGRKRIFSNLTYLGWDNLNFLIAGQVDENIITTFFKELFKLIDLLIYKNISQSCQQIIVQHTKGSISFKGFRCPFVNLPQSYQTFLDSTSVSFKRMVKNRTNFCNKHGLEFRFLSNTRTNSLEDAIKELNRLHEIRMDEIDAESKFLKSDSQRFHKIMRGYTNKEFILIIQAVEGEKVVGTLYGFISSDRYAYFASGIDTSYSKYSLGVVLIGQMMDYLISNNYKYFDFLRGTEDYKSKWTKESNQNYTVYSFANIFGRTKAMKHYWEENERRLGRKKTLVNLKRFLGDQKNI